MNKETTYPKTNFLTKEVLVLRRLRILKKIKRKKVAEALGVCVAVVDRFENGRTKMSIGRRNKLLKIYKISHDEFRKMTDGEIKIPDLPPHSVYEHKKEDLSPNQNLEPQIFIQKSISGFFDTNSDGICDGAELRPSLDGLLG